MIKFKSKKNDVYLKDEKTVLKRFNLKQSFDVELLMLNQIEDFVPRIKDVDSNTYKIEMEYIEGELLIDSFIKGRKSDGIVLARMLANTIKFIYSSTNKIPNDETFRNYIIKGNKIYRVDFEETKDGSVEEWLVSVCAFAVMYSASVAIKKSFIKTLLNEFDLDIKFIKNNLENEIIFLSDRWGKSFPKNTFDTLLK